MIFTNEKVKTVMDVLKRKVSTAGTFVAAIPVLEFLQAEKQKTGYSVTIYLDTYYFLWYVKLYTSCYDFCKQKTQTAKDIESEIYLLLTQLKLFLSYYNFHEQISKNRSSIYILDKI